MSLEKNKKKSFKFPTKIYVCVLSFIMATSFAVSIPIILQQTKKYYLTSNHSTDTKEGNERRINYYIDNVLNKENLSSSLKVYGKTGFLGNNGKELTSNQRSLITVAEAAQENLFHLKFNSAINYSLRKNKINYELAYVKPYYANTSYATVGLKLFYGSGATYYETYYEFRDSDLYGFKVSIEQTLFDYYANLINARPIEYFELKKEIGQVGQIGLYAKNIKTTDFNLNNAKLIELKKENFGINIISVNADNNNPTLLKISYEITYDDGITTLSSLTNQAYLGNFDVEQGVDDPQSKLRKFIENNKDWIQNLNQSFEYKKPKNDEKTYTVREAFQAGYIKFSTNYSINSKLESDGITIEFKNYVDEDKNNLSAFNSKFDSTTPTYRVFFSSYSNTPMQYTESVTIDGIAQEGDFAISAEEKKIIALNYYLDENNKGFEDIFDLDASTNNPLALSDYFIKDNKISFNNNKYSLSFNIVYDLYQKYSAKENKINQKYPSPFKEFKYILKTGISLPLDYQYENETYNLQQIVNDIVSAANDNKNGSFETQFDSISTSATSAQDSIKLNIFLGSKENGTIYTSVIPWEVYVSNYFETKAKYLEDVLKKIQISKDNVIVKLNLASGPINETLLSILVKERQWTKIFLSEAVLYNITSNTIPFPDLLSPLKVSVDLNYFDTFDGIKIDEIIKTKSIDIAIKISIDTIETQTIIKKTFTELLQGK